MSGSEWLKPVRRARLWLALWWCAIALVVLFSLLPAADLPQVPSGGDKLEHFLAYAALAAIAVQLFSVGALLRVACGLALLGVILEIAQGMFTSTRFMDASDALANGLGVVAGAATLWTPSRDWLLRFDRSR